MAASRISYRTLPAGIDIRIRAPRNIWGLVFLPFWWSGWTIGVVFAFITVLTEGQPFVALWLLIAVPFWFAVPAIWLWWLVGYEEILVNGESVSVGRKLFRLRLIKDFPLGEVRHLRAAGFFGDPWKASNFWAVNGYWWGFGGGMVAFDWTERTQRFGINLEESDARDIVAKVRPFIPVGG